MNLFKRWRTVGIAVGAVVAVELLSRIVLPGINGEAVRSYLANGGSGWLLTLYDRLGGGALARGGLLAIGVMPYIAAKIWIRLAQMAAPKVKALTETAAGQQRLTRITRWLTAGLSLVQSIGYVQMLEKIPGALTQPGIGFVVPAVVTLTGASIAAMMLAEYARHALLERDDETTLPLKVKDLPPSNVVLESNDAPQLTSGPASMPVPKARVSETINSEHQ